MTTDHARTLARIPLGSMQNAATELRAQGHDAIADVVERHQALYAAAIDLELARAGTWAPVEISEADTGPMPKPEGSERA